MLEAKDADDMSRGAWAPAPTRSAGETSASTTRQPVLIVLHQQQSTPGHIGRWLEQNGYRLDIRRPRFGDPLPETMTGHAGAVVFGGPMSANDPDDYIRAETDWIAVPLAEDKPFLGICLGGQMLANHLGGRVWSHPGQHVEIGYHAIRPTAAAAQLCAWPHRFYQWHREGFDMPGSSQLLATADGPFEQQAFAYGSAVALQFHPEITYAQINRWTGYNGHRLGQTGAQPRQQHLDGHFVHAPSVHRWLDDFLPYWLAGCATAARIR